MLEAISVFRQCYEVPWGRSNLTRVTIHDSLVCIRPYRLPSSKPPRLQLITTESATAQSPLLGVLSEECMPTGAEIRKPLILCVEDDQGYLRLRRAVLKKNGYSVLGATTGAKALDVLRRSPVSLVISDHMLGETSGTELANEMKRLKPLVPILLYAGTMPEHLGAVNCFLAKTEPVETFLAMVASLVKRYLAA